MKTEHSTFEIETDFNCNVEKLFAALTTEATKKLWYADEAKSHDLIEFTSDLTIGGKEKCIIVLNEKTPVPGLQIEMYAECMARDDNEALLLNSRMESGGKILSVSIETFKFYATETGSKLNFTCQAIFLENADGPILRRAGWETMFAFLKGILH